MIGKNKNTYFIFKDLALQNESKNQQIKRRKQ